MDRGSSDARERSSRELVRLQAPRRTRSLPLVAMVILMVLSLLMPLATLGKPTRDRAERPAAAGDQLTAEERARIMEARAKLPGNLALRMVTPEVVGGQPVPPGTYSFMAALFRLEADGFFYFTCGGSVIHPSYVLTAAHCVTAEPDEAPIAPEFFALVVGRVDLSSEAPLANVRFVTANFVHPDWNWERFRNDAAVLRLDSPIPESLAQPIKLIGSGDQKYEGAGQSVTVAGWGAPFTGGGPVSSLLAAPLNVVGDAACEAAWGDSGPFDPAIMLCAAAPARDSCQGDSGGPLFVRDVVGTEVVKKKKGKRKKRIPIYGEIQIGIVSFGALCADPLLPGVYTQLSNPGINGLASDFANSPRRR